MLTFGQVFRRANASGFYSITQSSVLPEGNTDAVSPFPGPCTFDGPPHTASSS